MPPKKNAKSNKTAHVLNLLSHAPEPEPAAETGSNPTSAAAAALPAAEPAPQAAAPLVPPMLEDAHSLDSSLAEAIRGALEDDLEGYMNTQNTNSELSEAQELSAEPASLSFETPAEEPDLLTAALEELAAKTPQAEEPAAPKEEPVVTEAPDMAQLAQPASAKSVEEWPDCPACPATAKEDEDIIYVNVMQELVEEKADKYIKLFGLCPCRRCRVDVKALALSHLPPKYVVMHRGEMIPMLTFYEGQYSVGVTAQLAQACQQVMEHPRHKL